MASTKYMNVYINDSFSIAGPMEKQGLIKDYNIMIDDYYYGEKTFENAEVKMQKVVIDNLLGRNKLKDVNIGCVVGGELSNQIATTNYALKDYNIPFLGIYSACACYIQSLIILANMLESKILESGIVITSSHNLVSEKQFRFPSEYGSLKPDYTTFTSTGSAGSIVSSKSSNIKVESSTIGRVIDYGIKDVFNMGAVMAPAAAFVLTKHLNDLKRKVDYYDLILTGDLGKTGSEIFKEILDKDYNIKIKNHSDAGSMIYSEEQETYAGASGPLALPLVLITKIIKEKKYKKILLIGTGCLHSPVMVNQKQTIPGIAHAIGLEVNL